ncbi:MAG: ABC transporter ATP-binding protein [Roseiflexaceae bacterium]
MSAYITASGLVKIFKVADLEVVALQGLDLEIEQGEFVALVGPSGSGKSTLMSALGGLDRPSAGKLMVGGRDLLSMSAQDLSSYRRERVGFVWQQTTRNLLPYLTARENVDLLTNLAGGKRVGSAKARKAWVDELLEATGAAAFANRRPPQLSGGQQQRVALACALANRPEILLGDEPTGEVDWPTAQLILALLRDLRTRYGLTLVTVTHDPRVAAVADRVIAIRDGRVSSEVVRFEDGQPVAAERHGSERVVIDAAGRLQLPIDQRGLAGIGRRATIEVVDGGLLIRPSDDGNQPEAEANSANDTDLDVEGLYGN